MDDEKATQAQAPTDEMQFEEAARTLFTAIVYEPKFGDEWKHIAAALAAQDRLARAEERERCAKLVRGFGLLNDREENGAEYSNGVEETCAALAALIEGSAALRAQGEK